MLLQQRSDLAVTPSLCKAYEEGRAFEDLEAKHCMAVGDIAAFKNYLQARRCGVSPGNLASSRRAEGL